MGADVESDVGEILERLKIIRGERTQEEFAARFDLKSNTYSYIEKYGKTLSLELLRKIAKQEGINLNWLITGQGDLHYSDEPHTADHQAVYRPKTNMSLGSLSSLKSLKSLPIVGQVAAGEPTIIYSDIEEAAEVSDTIDDWFFHKIKYNYDNHVVFVRVNGDSMEPRFLDLDLLLIERGISFQSLKSGVFGIFKISDEYTFKRLNIQQNNLLLEPLNSKYSTILADKNNIEIYGIAIALFRSLKDGMLCL